MRAFHILSRGFLFALLFLGNRPCHAQGGAIEVYGLTFPCGGCTRRDDGLIEVEHGMSFSLLSDDEFLSERLSGSYHGAFPRLGEIKDYLQHADVVKGRELLRYLVRSDLGMQLLDENPDIYLPRYSDVLEEFLLSGAVGARFAQKIWQSPKVVKELLPPKLVGILAGIAEDVNGSELKGTVPEEWRDRAASGVRALPPSPYRDKLSTELLGETPRPRIVSVRRETPYLFLGPIVVIIVSMLLGAFVLRSRRQQEAPIQSKENEDNELRDVLRYFSLVPGVRISELTKEFRVRVKKLHPDVRRDGNVQEFVELQERYAKAKELLLGRERLDFGGRKDYDERKGPSEEAPGA